MIVVDPKSYAFCWYASGGTFQLDCRLLFLGPSVVWTALINGERYGAASPALPARATLREWMGALDIVMTHAVLVIEKLVHIDELQQIRARAYESVVGAQLKTVEWTV